jgi:hypothetical protein
MFLPRLRRPAPAAASALPTAAGPAGPAGPAGGDAYVVAGEAERERLLRGLAIESAPLVITGPAGAPWRATLAEADATRRRLTLAPAAGPVLDPAAEVALAALVEAGEAHAVAWLDRVRLAFDLEGLALVRGVRGAVLQAAWPRAVQRFQRRETFRVAPPEPGHAPFVHLTPPGQPGTRVAMRVVDISAGGCALWRPADGPALPAGTELEGVRVMLDATTMIDTTLRLQHVTGFGVLDDAGAAPGEAPHAPAGPAGAAGGERLGCAWGRMDAASRRALQRWIDAAQKRPRRRDAGAA